MRLLSGEKDGGRGLGDLVAENGGFVRRLSSHSSWFIVNCS